MHKIILDTDIGTDVDDILALSLALYSPEIELLAVTAAYGDTVNRGKLVYQVLNHAGKQNDIPVAAGRRTTLEGNRTIWEAGHEGRNAETDCLSDTVLSPLSAVDLMIRTIEEHPDEIVLCAIAPLTNVAEAVLKAPETMKKLKGIYMMGGVFGNDDRQLQMPCAEHNIICDPEAAAVVFGSGIPVTLFPLDVTLKTPLTQYDIRQLGQAADPLHKLLYTEICTWLDFIKKEFGRDHTQLHDPLTLAALADPSIIIRTLKTGIRVETRGDITTGATIPAHNGLDNVNVVLEVDISRFFESFSKRVIDTVEVG